ncbi:unnamed protein product [Amoebophrya sp. A25]|nr:unnamed protein product [Amoebophrya sp. A25]|eukprot:GSA25T00021545001.1
MRRITSGNRQKNSSLKLVYVYSRSAKNNLADALQKLPQETEDNFINTPDFNGSQEKVSMPLSTKKEVQSDDSGRNEPTRVMIELFCTSFWRNIHSSRTAYKSLEIEP